jgi:hypothetical protein
MIGGAHSKLRGEVGEPVAEPQTSLKVRTAAWLAAALIRGLRASVRLHFHEAKTVRGWESRAEHFILTFWHRHLLLMPYARPFAPGTAGLRYRLYSRWTAGPVGHGSTRCCAGCGRNGLAGATGRSGGFATVEAQDLGSHGGAEAL